MALPRPASAAAEGGEEVDLAGRFHAGQQAAGGDDAVDGDGQAGKNAVVIDEAGGQAGTLRLEVADHLPQREALDLNFAATGSEVSHLRRDKDGGHASHYNANRRWPRPPECSIPCRWARRAKAESRQMPAVADTHPRSAPGRRERPSSPGRTTCRRTPRSLEE